MRVLGCVVCVLVELSCGGDDDCCKLKPPDASAPDIAQAIDAPVQTIDARSADAPVTALCTAASTYPPPPVPGRAFDYASGLFGTGSPHEIDYVASLDTNTPRDVLYVALFAGYGAFGAGDITTGTFTIAGDDTKFSTCGICVLIATDITNTGSIGDWYMATAGTITLDSVDINQLGGDGSAHFTGTLTNASFVHVAKSAQGGPSDALQDTCTSAIPSAALDATMAVGTAGLTSDESVARVIASDRSLDIHVLRNRRL